MASYATEQTNSQTHLKALPTSKLSVPDVDNVDGIVVLIYME